MSQLTLGLYGKIPAHGDFIDRQLPVSFISSWDKWIQNALASSRERLGENWLNLYLTSAIWRFALSPGCLNDQCWTGVLVPSVDSVGRYFPLTIATALEPRTGLATFIQQNERWFQALERAALAALQDGLNAEQLDEQLKQAPMLVGNNRTELYSNNIAAQSDKLTTAQAIQLDVQITRSYESYSLWLSVYTQPPMQYFLIAQNMPTADQYTAMIDNQWQSRGWDMAADAMPADTTIHADTMSTDTMPTDTMHTK